MATWLVTGAEGMLGSDLVRLLHEVDEHVIPTTRALLDITDKRAVDAAVSTTARIGGDHGGAIVVNLAAWTDVDAAEVDEEAAAAVNADAPGRIAEACGRADVRMIHVSTDYVFDGASREPYPEDASTAPATAYGRTKAAGERAVLDAMPGAVVLRTGWLYGAHGRNFVRTMAQLAAERDIAEVVDDQRGQPTWSVDLAMRIIDVGRLSAASGVLHATSSGSTTWYGLARAVFTELGLDPDRVRPITSDQMPRLAPRPAYSVLGHGRWAEYGLSPLRPWREALTAAAPTVLSVR